MNKIRKTTNEKDKQFLLDTKVSDMTKTFFNTYFAKRLSNGRLISARYDVEDLLILKKDDLPNIFEDITTTVGRFILNKICIADLFGNLIPYFNKRVLDGFDELDNYFIPHLESGKINVRDYYKYIERITWLCYQKAFFSNATHELLIPNNKIIKYRDELVKKHKKIIDENDIVKYYEYIENPLMKYVKEVLSEEKSFDVIYGDNSKPSLGNSYKETCVIIGPITTVNGDTKIITTNLSEGYDEEDLPKHGNLTIAGSYSRAKATAEGGQLVKEIMASLQFLEIDEDPHSNCGTKQYLDIEVNEDMFNIILYRYFLDRKTNKEVEITKSMKERIVGKTIKMRSSLFCIAKKICSKCIGRAPHIKKTYKIGISKAELGGIIMQRALSNMHNLVQKTMIINNFNNYLREIKI